MRYIKSVVAVIITIALLGSTGIVSAAKIPEACVQVNGKIIKNSQWTSKVMGAVESNLGKAIIIFPKDPALINEFKNDAEIANETVNVVNGEKTFPKMFRIFVNGEFVRDTLKVDVAKKIIQDNLAKGNIIKIRLRTPDEKPKTSTKTKISKGTRVVNNTDGPITVRAWVTTDDHDRAWEKTDDFDSDFFHTLDVIHLDPGCEKVIDFDKRIAQARKELFWELRGNVLGMYIETQRVLERISVDEQECKRYITNREKICRVPVVHKNSTLYVSDIELSPSCEITETIREEYVE